MKKFMPFESVLPDIRSEGNLLPADMLMHILHRDRGIPGLTEDDYHLIGGVRLTEAINQSWQKMQTVWTNFAAKMSSFPSFIQRARLRTPERGKTRRKACSA